MTTSAVIMMLTILFAMRTAAADTNPPVNAPQESAQANLTAFLVPHEDLGRGDPASETLAAATRLHGLTRCFTPDTFISHILYVTGVTNKDLFPKKSWAVSLARRLARKGVIRSKMTPEPGDLVFFSLSSAAPHSSKASKVSIGVVEKVRKGRLDFILAGSRRVIRGTLKTGKAHVSETRLVSCEVVVNKKSKSKSKKGKAGTKSKNSGSTKKKVPCRASELLIGFADIDEVALELNPIPPSPPCGPTDEDTAAQMACP